MSKKIVILAGEASGDMYGAQLVAALRTYQPDLQFLGMGSSKMAAAGVELIVNANDVSVVGAVEVLTHFPAIYRAAKKLKALLRHEKPDLLILIDFPDFNFHIGQYAKRLHIPIAYYISPQVWAWRKGRIHTIKKFVDLMTVILPFEVEFYRKHNIPVFFAGHPLVDLVKTTSSKEASLKTFELNNSHPIIGLLPGSRHSEIRRLLPTILESARLLKQRYPNAQFILPLAHTLTPDSIAPYLQGYQLPITIIKQGHHNALQLCDLTITASGTMTLEIALLAIPQIVIYKFATLSYWLAKLLIRVPYFALCNLVANDALAPEFFQEEANPERIATEAQAILDHPQRQALIRDKCLALKTTLGKQQVTDKIAHHLVKRFLL